MSWPQKALWPNRPAHWSRRSVARRQQREEAYWATRVAIGSSGWPSTNTIITQLPVALTFLEPDRRARDLDNMTAAMKGALDGVSQALGVDDKLFDLRIARGDVVRGGRVVIEVPDL